MGTRTLVTALAVTALVSLSACQSIDLTPSQPTLATQQTVSTTQQTYEFVPSPPVTVTDNLIEHPIIADPGRHVSWVYLGVTAGTPTGAVIHIKLINNGDVAFPPTAIPEPELIINGQPVAALPDEKAGIVSGLDLPLGVGAATILDYAFDTWPENLFQASLTMSSVTWQGDLFTQKYQ